MLKKSFLAIMLVAIGIFAAFGTAQADQIDGLVNGNGILTVPTDGTPGGTLTMYVNPGGLGDALIYGYYNARGAWDFIRVVNTSTTVGVGAKVRFREGRNSNEVLDFAICLSAGDQWSAWLIDDGDSSNPATLIWYDDDTVTAPDPNGDNDETNNMGATVALKYAPNAASSVTADDTKEGYLEIIGASAWLEGDGPATPNECNDILGIVPGKGTSIAQAELPVPNVLFGNLYVFQLSSTYPIGTYAYNATALANFRRSAISVSLASDSQPRLDDAYDINGFAAGLDEVNYVLTKAVEYATYDIETWLTGNTTIINTFPTKRLTIAAGNSANRPFNSAATVEADGKIADADARCEEVEFVIWDDAEHFPTTTSGFSPGETTVLKKCDEVTLVVVGATANPVVNSNLVNVNINAPSGYVLGWISENFTTVAGRYTDLNWHGSLSADGLPVISYEMQNIAGVLSHMLPLRYEAQFSYKNY